jgi:hypothetical protein
VIPSRGDHFVFFAIRAAASVMKTFRLLALVAPLLAEAQQSVDVPGFGRIEVEHSYIIHAFVRLC